MAKLAGLNMTRPSPGTMRTTMDGGAIEINTLDRTVGFRQAAGRRGRVQMTPQQRAERSAEAMWAKDAASQWLGMRLDAVGPGSATTSMEILPHHLNGHGICHGGYIFTLADSAFAFACNSYNALTVAQENSITFLAPARPGERLIAVASETARSGRSGVYDVTVTGDEGRKVAVFRGLSRTVAGQHFEEET
jgi:acyl-CoA thioesterase